MAQEVTQIAKLLPTLPRGRLAVSSHRTAPSGLVAVCLLSLCLRIWAILAAPLGDTTLTQSLRFIEQAEYQSAFFGGLAWLSATLLPGLEPELTSLRIIMAMIFAVAIPGLTYGVGRRVASPAVGLVAALMTAIAPMLIDFSYSTMLYTSLAGVGLGGSWFLLNAVERSQRGAVAGWLGLRAIAIGWMPMMGVFLLSDVFIILWRHMGRPRRWFRVALSGVLGSAALALMSPTLPSAPSSVSVAAAASTPPSGLMPSLLISLGTIVQTTVYWPLHQLAQSASARAVTELASDRPPLSPILFYGFIGVILTALMLIPVMAALRQARTSSLSWTVALAMLPIAGLLILSAANQAVLSPRYWVVVAPYLMILMAYGWVQLWRRGRFIALGVAGLYGMAIGGGLSAYFFG